RTSPTPRIHRVNSTRRRSGAMPPRGPSPPPPRPPGKGAGSLRRSPHLPISKAGDRPGEGGMAEIAIGIDLRTSNSCAAVRRDGPAPVPAHAQTEPTTASVIGVREDGSILVGNVAKANLIHDPKHTICSAKRLIGRSFHSAEVKKAKAISGYEIVPAENNGLRIRVRDQLFSIPEISAMILRELKPVAEMRLSQPGQRAVITVRANVTDTRRLASNAAGLIAGLDVLRMLSEPSAAALAYGFGRGLSQKVAVYDLGGGTFDISVLEIGQDVFEVLS